MIDRGDGWVTYTWAELQLSAMFHSERGGTTAPLHEQFWWPELRVVIDSIAATECENADEPTVSREQPGP